MKFWKVTFFFLKLVTEPAVSQYNTILKLKGSTFEYRSPGWPLYCETKSLMHGFCGDCQKKKKKNLQTI